MSPFPTRRPDLQQQDAAVAEMDRQAAEQDFIAQQQKDNARMQQMQEEQAREAARAQKAALANAKRQGVKIAPDATGAETIQRHPDGQPVYEAGFVGEPQINDKGGAVAYRDARGQRYDVPFDAIRSEPDPTGETFYSFDVTAPDGTKQTMRQPAGSKPLFRVDPGTGSRIVDVTDPATGSVQPRVVGVDPLVANKAAIEKRKNAAQLAQNERSGAAEELRLQLAQKNTLLQPVAEKLKAAQDAADKLAKEKTSYEQAADGYYAVTTLGDGVEPMRRKVDAPQEIAKADAWVKNRSMTEKALADAKAEYDPAAAEIQTMQERRDALALETLRENRRMQAEIRRMEEAAKAGKDVTKPDWQKRAESLAADPRMSDLATVADMEAAGDPLAPDVQAAAMPETAKMLGRVWQAGFQGEPKSLLQGMLDGVTALNPGQKPKTTAEAQQLAAKSIGIADPASVSIEADPLGHYALRYGNDEFATYSPEHNRIHIIATAAGLNERAAELIANADKDGVPVYLSNTYPNKAEQPFNAAELRGLMADGLAAVQSADTQEVAESSLAAAGLSPDDIRGMVRAGKLSVQDGRMMLDKFHGVDAVNYSRPAIEQELGRVLSTSNTAKADWEAGNKAAVINRVMDQVASKATSGVVVDRAILEQRRQELLAQHVKEGAVSKVGGFLKELILPMVGIGGQAAAYVPQKLAKWSGYETEAGRLSEQQFTDWQKRTGSFVNKMMSRDDVTNSLAELRSWAQTANPGDTPPDDLAEKIAGIAYDGYHELTDDAAKALNTSRDTFNVNRDPMLRAALSRYLTTADPAAFDQLSSLLMLDGQDRKTQAEVSAYISAPRVATPADVVGRAKGLGIDLTPEKANALMGLTKQLDKADPKAAQGIITQAGKILGLEGQEAAETLSRITADETDDPESAWGLLKGGFVAGRQELLTEVASTAAEAGLAWVTAGAATPEIIAERAARQGVKTGIRAAIRRQAQAAFTKLADSSTAFAKTAATLGKARQTVGTGLANMGEAFAKAGIKPATFGQPLTRADKVRNAAVQVGKNAAAAAPMEALEEGVAAIGEPDPNAASIGEQMLMGAAGGLVLTPMFAGAAAVGQAWKNRGAGAEWEKRKAGYVEELNRRMEKVPGFKPLTVADFDAWQGLQDNPAQAQARQTMLDAMRGHEAAVMDWFNANAGDMQAAPSPAMLAAQASVERAGKELGLATSSAFMAMDELRAIPETERPLYTAAAKAATGARDFTEAEAKALMAQGGNNAVVFQQAQVMPADVAGPPAQRAVSAPAVSTVAPGVYRLPAGVRVDVPPALLDSLVQKAPTMVDLLRQPANQSPAVQAVVAKTDAAKQAMPKAPKGKKAKPAKTNEPNNQTPVQPQQGGGPVMQGPGQMPVVQGQPPAQAPTPGATAGVTPTPTGQTTGQTGEGAVAPAAVPKPTLPAKAIEKVTREAIGRIAAKSPRIKALLKESKKAHRYPTGGMWLEPDGTVMYHVQTIVKQLESIGVTDNATAGKRVEALLDEEIRHSANMEAARRLFAGEQAAGRVLRGMSFETWRDAWYGDIWNSHFTDAMRQAVQEAYGDTLPEADWMRAMEGLRMLDQLRATGSITEAVLLALDAILESLREFLDLVTAGGKKVVEAEIMAIREVLAEYGYEGGTVKPDAKKKPAKAKASKKTPDENLLIWLKSHGFTPGSFDEQKWKRDGHSDSFNINDGEGNKQTVTIADVRRVLLPTTSQAIPPATTQTNTNEQKDQAKGQGQGQAQEVLTPASPETAPRESELSNPDMGSAGAVDGGSKLREYRDVYGKRWFIADSEWRSDKTKLRVFEDAAGTRRTFIVRDNIVTAESTGEKADLVRRILAAGYQLPAEQFRETESQKGWRQRWEQGWRPYGLNEDGQIVPAWEEVNGQLRLTDMVNFLWAKPQAQQPAASQPSYNPRNPKVGDVVEFDWVGQVKQGTIQRFDGSGVYVDVDEGGGVFSRRNVSLKDLRPISVSNDTNAPAQKRDLSVTKPTGITGNTLPYPANPHHWTKDEFENFLVQNKFPPNTIGQRVDGHYLLVVEALYKGQWVPPEVLADYPEAAAHAERKKQADRGFTQMAQDDRAKQAAFMLRLEQDEEFAARFKAAIQAAYQTPPRADDNANVRSRGTFLEGGAPYWFLVMKNGALLVWQGQDGVGAAREPIARLDAAEYFTPAPVEVNIITSNKPAKPADPSREEWQKTYAKFKRALAKAVKAKDYAEIIRQADAFQAHYEADGNGPFPDSWSDWERHKADAEMQLARQGQTGNPLVVPTLKPVNPPRPSKGNGNADYQAAQDATREALQGLFSAPAFRAIPQLEVPAERFDAVRKAAVAILNAKIRTPEDFARFMDDTFPGGKARPYSEAIWDMIGIADKSLRGSHDWSRIYGQIDTPLPDVQEPEAETPALANLPAILAKIQEATSYVESLQTSLLANDPNRQSKLTAKVALDGALLAVATGAIPQARAELQRASDALFSQWPAAAEVVDMLTDMLPEPAIDETPAIPQTTTDEAQSAIRAGDQAPQSLDPSGGSGSGTREPEATRPGYSGNRPDVGERMPDNAPPVGGSGDSGGIRKRPVRNVTPAVQDTAGGLAGESGPSAGGNDSQLPGTGTGMAAPEHTPSRSNYWLADPESIVGGGPKARFARNRKALEILEALQEENRDPTPEELDTLAAYTGWGAFGQELFKGTYERSFPAQGWEEESDWLKNRLGKADWESAQESILNAHYTDPPTVSAMWDMIRRMGFTGGRVLEPSLGTGNFFSLMPRDLMASSQLSGIELDPTTASIAKFLHPQANIRQMGYEESTTGDNFYDLIVGNWPFKKGGPADRRYNHLNASLHDYFFVKAIDQVRPGGLVVGITSAGTMDKKSKAVRSYLASRGELVASFRLPTGAFGKYAGTNVVTDIVILRKRETPLQDISGETWVESVKDDRDRDFFINAYYQTPEGRPNILGKLDFGSGSTYGRPAMIVTRSPDYEQVLPSVAQSLPKNVMQPWKPGEKKIQYIANTTSFRRQNAIVAQGDELYQVNGENLGLLQDLRAWKTKDQAKRLADAKSLLDLRSLLDGLMDAYRKGEDTTKQRETLLAAYTAHVKAHGPLHKSRMLDLFRKAGDPTAADILNMEEMTEKGPRPRAILTQDIMRKRVVDAKGSIADAYALARNNSLQFSVSDVAEAAGVSVAEAEAYLIEQGQIYRTPQGVWEPADVYLAGNVRQKLREAQAAKAEGIEGMERNIAALESIQPADTPYFEIEVQMGASWIPISDYQDFIGSILQASPDDVEIVKSSSGYNVKLKKSAADSSLARSQWGTEYVHPSAMFGAAMNSTPLKVYSEPDKDGVRHLLAEQTEAANQKRDAIREELVTWLWSDPVRTGRLVREYNESMNAVVTPKRDGSHLRLEGLALTLGRGEFDFRQHQRDAVWRFLLDGKGVGAHEVGTGKTFTIAGLAMEGRRLGVLRKPMILAHNANSSAIAADISKAYPSAKVLYLDDLGPQARENAMRQIKLDDWDAVVVPHSLISRFALKRETMMRLVQPQIDQLEAEFIAALDELDNAPDVDFHGEFADVAKALARVKGAHTAKDLMKRKIKIEEDIEKRAQATSKEGAISFEELGIDAIIVDEAHIFKKIPLATRKNFKGLQKEMSGAGFQLQLMTDYLKSINNGKGVFLFTGTPVTNTLNEVFNMMRFVMQDEFTEAQIANFDDWFNSFAQATSDIELTSGGTFEPIERVLSFINIPELARMASRVFDVVRANDMPEFKPRASDDGLTDDPVGRPRRLTVPVIAEMSPDQREHKRNLEQRYREYQALDGKGKMKRKKFGGDVPAIIETDGRKSALDHRVFDPGAADFAGSKLNLMVGKIMEHFREHPKATQMVFQEIGVNDYADRERTVRDGEGNARMDANGKPLKEKFRVPTFNLLRDMVEKLVAQGVRPEEIAVFHNMSLDPIAERPNDVLRKVRRISAATPKEELAAMMNRGEIRVAFGSTQTMGTGVNAQEWLRAMHHLDAPWTPGEFEQRNGRGWRQGNRWNTVMEYRYFTEESHDGKMWQTLLNKVRFIERFTSMLQGKGTVARVLEGEGADTSEDGSVSDFEQSFSSAAGDPRLLVRAKLEKEVQKLQRRRQVFVNSIANSRDKIRDLNRWQERDAANLPKFEQDHAAFLTAKEPFSFTLYRGRSGRDLTEGLAELQKRGATPAEVEAFQRNAVVFTERKDATDALERLPRYTTRQRIGEFGPFGIYAESTFAGTKFEVTGPSGYTYNFEKPSMQSLEATLGFLKRRSNGLREDMAKREQERAALQDSLSKPWSREADLAAKEKALAQIQLEITASPTPAPSWLRHGAPTGSLIYVRNQDGGLDALDVAAHRWDANDYWILVDNGTDLVPVRYNEALTETGSRLFQDYEFQSPGVQPAADAGAPNIGTYDLRDIMDAEEGRSLSSAPAPRITEAAQAAAAAMQGQNTAPAGLRSLFNPQAKRPATGERRLFDRPNVDPLTASIAKAYRAVQQGQSSVMVPIRAVFQRMKAADPALTVESYLAAIQEADQRGEVMLEAANTTAEQDANAPFVVPSQNGPGIRMAWVDRGGGDTGNRPPTTHIMPDGYELTGPGMHMLASAPIRAFHGTPHKVDKFRLDKIGTGEGAQAYGWGLYFAENPSVADDYRRNLTDRNGTRKMADGTPVPSWVYGEVKAGRTKQVRETFEKRIVEMEDRIQREQGQWWNDRSNLPGLKSILVAIDRMAAGEQPIEGNLYTVELLPDESEFLDWDKPLSEQSEKVKAALRDLPLNPQMRGMDIYDRLRTDILPLGRVTHLLDAAAKQVSERLASLGIPGIKYLDAGSRGAGDGTRNFVIFDENLVRILEENGKPVSEAPLASAPVRTLPEAPFYSKLSRVVSDKMPNRADVATIKGIISNTQTGIKAEEIKWSGIMPWLDAQEGMVTKQAVLDYLASDGAVRLEEVRMGAQYQSKKFPIRQIAEGWDVWDNARNESALRAPLATEEEARQFVRMFDTSAFPQFAQYQLPGGENYREVVLAMPKIGGLKVYDTSTGKSLKEGFETFSEAQRYIRENALTGVNIEPIPADNYTSSHFPDVPNYVAHARLNDREDAEGRPGTFIEEIQSDRHQAGREKGYRDNLKFRVYDAQDQEIGRFATEKEAQAVVNQDFDNRTYREFGNRATGDVYLDDSIPDAPFRKDWPLQMFKRALADAVAAGKQWIGWTTGDTQAERYDLSKQVDDIAVWRNGALYGFDANKDGKRIITQNALSAQELALNIGKDLAGKAVQDLETNGKPRVYSGDALKVGGHGMKGFYDAILPKEIGRYVKQWGAGVVKGGMPTGFVPRRFADGQWYLSYAGNVKEVDSRRFATREEALAAQYPIWRVDITPQMKSGVESGQALFSAPIRKAKPAMTPNRATQAMRDIIEALPPPHREVLRDLLVNGMSIEDAATTHNISETAVGNILRRGEAHIRLMLDRAPTKPTVRVQDGVVKATYGRPDLAMSGNAAVAAVDQRRMTPEEVTHAEMQELATRLFDVAPAEAESLVVRWMDSGTTVLSTDGMPDSIKAIVADAQARNAAEMMMTAAAKMLVARKTLEGGNSTQLARLIYLYRNTGTEQARALGMRRDPFDTPEERAAMYLSEALLTPPDAIKNELRRNPANRDRILAAWAKRADEIKAEMLAHGIDLDATFADHAEEQKLVEETIPEPVKPALARAPKKTRQLVKAIMQGMTPAEAIRAAGLTAKAAFNAYQDFRASLNQTGTEAAQAMRDQLLRSAPVQGADFAANLGLPDLTEAEWLDAVENNRPLRTTPETEKLKQHREKAKKAGTLDLKNSNATRKAMRAIEERKSNAFEKISEFWRASILSGPQTHVVNLVSGLTYGAYEASFKKLAAGVQGDIARMFGAKPDAASLADIPAMIAASLPSIKLAFLDGIAAWKSETRAFENYALQLRDDNGELFKEQFNPALKGKLGAVMRGISFRLMGAADEFVKSFFTRIEVAAQARQIARNEGKTGHELAKTIQELMEPGSLAWERALGQAKKITFQTEIGSGSAAVDAIDGLAKLITRTKKGDFGKPLKGLAHFTFPFVDTPTNIFKAGVTMSPVGGLLALVDMIRAYNRYRKGNAEEAAKIYNAARALDDLTNQIVAWGFILGLSHLVKPGDDEDETPWITGTIPWRSTSPGERELAYRTAPPQSIRIGDRWISYKRLDPFASALAFTVDAIKEFQSGKPIDEVWTKIGLGMMRNMQDKTFLQGVSDVVNAVQDPERFGTKWATNIATGFIPNLIRQPIRTADDVFRETDLPNDLGFWDALGRRMGYGIYPQGAMPSITVWGEPARKDTGTSGPNTDWMLRLLSPADMRAANVDMLDVALLRYNAAHQDGDPRALFGVTAPSRELQRTIGGQTIKISLDDAEYEDFITKAGKAARQAIGTTYDGRDLTEQDVDRIKDIVSRAHETFRNAAFVQAVQKRGGLNALANTTK